MKSGTYDFEANKALLKLYQFFPDLSKTETVALMLAKVSIFDMTKKNVVLSLCIIII